MSIPRWLQYLVVVLVVLSWVPLAVILRARYATSPKPRIHIIQDMDNQPKYKAQSRNLLFADRRAMRPPVAGTVARGAALGDPADHTGADIEGFVGEILPVSGSGKRGNQLAGLFVGDHGMFFAEPSIRAVLAAEPVDECVGRT